MKNWKSIAGVLLVFILGALSGALVAHKICNHRIESIMHGGPQVKVDVVVHRLSHKLDLDDAQQVELRKIVTGAHAEMEAVRKQSQPQVDAILDKADDQVRLILRPEQKERFEKFVAERKERWKERER